MISVRIPGAAASAAALFFGLAATADAAGGSAPELRFPVDCRPGVDCFIQNYLDRDPGPGAHDYACGSLVYDGHKGTDIALPDRAAMRRGVAVLAAAPGSVRAVRNDMPDHDGDLAAAGPLGGRDCGNGVRIDHGDGWESQYCHMARGSIAVAPGQALRAGDRLGEIGMSGRTEFPHLHFALRHDGEPVDPFRPAPAQERACTPPARSAAGLWHPPLAYLPGGIASAGFLHRLPEFEEIKAGTAAAQMHRDSGALVFWVQLFGTRAGDRLHLRIVGPRGAEIDQDLELTRTQARAFRAAGRRRPPDGWPAGRYRAEARLIRDGTELARTTAEIDLP